MVAISTVRFNLSVSQLRVSRINHLLRSMDFTPVNVGNGFALIWIYFEHTSEERFGRDSIYGILNVKTPELFSLSRLGAILGK